MALYTLVEISTGDAIASRLSIAGTLRAFRRVLRDYRHPRERGNRLRDKLKQALIDPYKRTNKTSRDYPRKKNETPAGKPELIDATKTQRNQAAAPKRQKKG